MYILQTDLITNLANQAVVGACVLSVGFMLRFLFALAQERKTSRSEFRMEYRLNSSLPNTAARRTWHRLPIKVLAQSGAEPMVTESMIGAELRSGTLQALAALTRESRLTDGFWPTRNARNFAGQTIPGG